MKTPECDRMVAVAEESHKLGEFLDWLNEQGIHLAEWQRETECTWSSLREGLRCVMGMIRFDYDMDDGAYPVEGVCKACDGTGVVDRLEPILVTRAESYNELLAHYFNIDLDKVEQERRAILKSLSA